MVSVPGVCEVLRQGPGDRPADFLIELPHGATEGAHFDAVRAKLYGDYPVDLREFFFVNTDVGAPECARKIAGRLAGDGRSVLILRGLVPRTFIDCNRRIDSGSDGIRGRKLTPLVPAYVRDERDIRTLIELYRAYQDAARQAYEQVCGTGGVALTLHTYAPRNVKIEIIDDDIVRKLHEAYEPHCFERWERRPDVDIISEDVDGKLLAPQPLVQALKREYAAIGIRVAENRTYRLLPESMGHVHSVAHPNRVLCLEVNRDLLADPFTPFEEMRIGPKKVARIAAPIAAALRQTLQRMDQLPT
jgi:hypothetical protein